MEALLGTDGMSFTCIVCNVLSLYVKWHAKHYRFIENTRTRVRVRTHTHTHTRGHLHRPTMCSRGDRSNCPDTAELDQLITSKEKDKVLKNS